VPLDLKSTLNLPKTDFPMKANLPQREPKRLEKWEAMRIYERIRQTHTGRPIYVLHDGPPYANGPIHLGHALNKTLKDFIVKVQTMNGFDAPYVPGWDCHGLPIEIKVDDALGRKKLEMDPMQVREACRRYAQKYLDLQREQFKRLGVFGRWDDPYSTMTPQYESVVADTFYSFYEQGLVYKGLKSVYWCIHDHTALAEAEVEYEMHSSPSVWVRYALSSEAGKIAPALAGKRNAATIIWTTTPWTGDLRAGRGLRCARHRGMDLHRRQGAGAADHREVPAQRGERDCCPSRLKAGICDVRPSLSRPLGPGCAWRLRHHGHGNGRGTHGPGTWCRRLPDRGQVWP